MSNLKTREYKAWAAMKERCQNTNCRIFKYYGGRGIKVCAAWQSYENFLRDMGPRPNGCTLDRINNDGDYCPENCRWVDMKTQARNRSNNIMLSYNGKTQCLSAWAEELEIEFMTLKKRLNLGWSIEKTLTTPLNSLNSSKRMVFYNGKTQCLAEWAREFNINPATLQKRLSSGWDVDKALTTPLRKW